MEEKLYQYLDRLKEHHPVVAFIVDVIEVYLDRRVSRSSAELAYYLLMTLFPMLIMVISAVGWLPLDSNMVIAFLKSIIPAQSYDLIADYVTYVLSHQSSGLFLAGPDHVHHRLLRSLPEPALHLRRDLWPADPSGGSGICSPPCSSPCCC